MNSLVMLTVGGESLFEIQGQQSLQRLVSVNESSFILPLWDIYPPGNSILADFLSTSENLSSWTITKCSFTDLRQLRSILPISSNRSDHSISLFLLLLSAHYFFDSVLLFQCFAYLAVLLQPEFLFQKHASVSRGHRSVPLQLLLNLWQYRGARADIWKIESYFT